MAYDVKCHDLALRFLDHADSEEIIPMPVLVRAAHALAQELQDTIESFLQHDLPQMRREHAQAQRDREEYARDVRDEMRADKS